MLFLCISQYAEKLFELGEAKSGVFNVLVTHVLDTWAEYLLDSTETVCYGGRTGRAPDTTTMTSLAMKASSEAAASVAEAVITSMKAHSDLLIKSALFGPVHKKNIRSVFFTLKKKRCSFVFFCTLQTL